MFAQHWQHGAPHLPLRAHMEYIHAEKREYRDRVETQFNNPWSMWQELNTIADFRGKTSALQTPASLCEELNAFCA